MAFAFCVSCTESKPGFAIVIDSQSYKEAKTEIDRYCSLVESRGLYPYLIIDRWGQPDSIRQQLITLYNDRKHPIEGCVFIGDIPVVMVRDAQHFTTALKMDQFKVNGSYSTAVMKEGFRNETNAGWNAWTQSTY